MCVQVIDLLSRSNRSAGGLRVREDQQRGFYVEGLRRVACDSAAQVEQLMEQGTRTRTTAATHLNANSSRSHMLIIIQLKQVENSNSVCVCVLLDTKTLWFLYRYIFFISYLTYCSN